MTQLTQYLIYNITYDFGVGELDQFAARLHADKRPQEQDPAQTGIFAPRPNPVLLPPHSVLLFDTSDRTLDFDAIYAAMGEYITTRTGYSHGGFDYYLVTWNQDAPNAP